MDDLLDRLAPLFPPKDELAKPIYSPLRAAQAQERERVAHVGPHGARGHRVGGTTVGEHEPVEHGAGERGLGGRHGCQGTAATAEAVRHAREMFATGDYTTVVADAPGAGIVATATSQRSGDVAEIVGVATLPSARRHGYASQLTATLARRLLAAGAHLVFLSAGDDDVARLYTRVGFRRVGTACIAEPAAAPL